MEFDSADNLLQPVVSLQHSRDDGNSFQIFDEIELCTKCNVKTVLCPHRRPQGEVFKLPLRSTNVKLVSVGHNQNSLKSQSHVRMLKLVEDIKFSLYETLTSLEEVWDDIGIKDDQKEERHGTVASHLQDLLGEMLAEECELKAKMQLRVEEYIKELDQLYNDLHLPRKPNPTGITLVNLEIQLRNDVDTLNKEKHDRLKWLRRLRDEEQSICEELVMTQHEINFVGTPTLEQLRELEQNVSFLKVEKNKRSKTFEAERKEVIALWVKLETDPVDEFEHKIKDRDSMFILSTSNLERVKMLKIKLENDHEELLLQIEEKRKKFKLLFDRLEQQLNVLEKDVLQQVPDQNTTSTLKILDLNITHLQKLKSRHLESFIQAIRSELQDLWNKCYFGEEQRRLFNAYYTDDYTEELLAEHEHQLSSMKHYYEDNKELFKLVCKREAIWDEKVDYESNDVGNARFNNRGGALLKALKKKQFIDKQLPKLSRQLKINIEKWEQENECIFTFNGVRYLDHMESQKQDYETEQKIKKDVKQQAKLQEMSPVGNKLLSKKTTSVMKSAELRSPRKRGQPNNCQNGSVNVTHCVYRSPVSKKKRVNISTAIPCSDKRVKAPSPVVNTSKYTHSSLQNNENQPKSKKPIMSKLTTQSMRKSLKRRSIKSIRVLKEKNFDMEATMNMEVGKVEPNISLVSYNDFSNKVVPFDQSSFREECHV